MQRLTLTPFSRLMLAAACACALLTACDKKSRFDVARAVDVCAIVPAAEAEPLLGIFQDAPTGQHAGRAHAGSCTWQLLSDKDQSPSSLIVMLMTPGVNAGYVDMGRWYKTSINEVAVSLGVEPIPVKRIGNEALLFENKRSRQTQIWMRQGQTYVTFIYNGERTDRLLEFAQTFSKRMEP